MVKRNVRINNEVIVEIEFRGLPNAAAEFSRLFKHLVDNFLPWVRSSYSARLTASIAIGVLNRLKFYVRSKTPECELLPLGRRCSV
jgi:hypothetical protein